MNRSILIVICDFLLVTLLAFSTVDINKLPNPNTPRNLKLNIATNTPDSGKDLAAVMGLALDEERKHREQLLVELARSREAATQRQTLLSEREKETQALQQQVRSRDEEAQRLQGQQAALQQQFAAAQTNLAGLNQQLRANASEAVLSKEKLAAMEAEARKQAQQAAALQQQLAHLASSNQVALAEKQRLSSQLQLAELEQRHATEQVARMTEEVKVEREEKAKLAEGVKALATKSTQLAEEIRENRSLAPNTIFSQFATNRVQARFNAYRSTLLGIDSSRRRETQTVLVSDGTNIFAMCHIQDTPLVLFNPAIEWESLTATLARNTALMDLHSLSFLLRDPRIVLMPVTQVEARQLGCTVYHISANPFKFQDAVLVGAREGYYGECNFQLDLATPAYLKLDHNFIKGLFGKFNPSSGDLVFSKTGDLLGIMVNNTYCLVLHNFDTAATFELGQDVRSQHTGWTLAQLYSVVNQLPLRLQ